MAVTIKTAREIELMRESNRRLEIVHDELGKMIRPGISTLDIDRAGEKLIRELGGIPNFLNYNGYPGSICTSVNEEVVHGKRSLLCRQPGDEWQQMAGLRVLSLWLMTHPGAKLTFMGNEIGQFIEWRYYEGIEYDEAQKMGSHATCQLFESMLNKFYLAQPALWELAHEREGFEWIEPNNAHQSVISFCRHGKDPADDLIVIINFRPVAYEQYRIGVPRAGYWREVLNTDDKLYGGSGVTNDFARFATDRKDFHKHTTSIKFRLPPLAGIVFRYDGDQKAALGTTHWIEDSAQQYLEMR